MNRRGDEEVNKRITTKKFIFKQIAQYFGLKTPDGARETGKRENTRLTVAAYELKWDLIE